MKYYLLNRQECRENINNNPKLLRTKSANKIKKLKTLQKKLDKLKKEVIKELKESNTIIYDEWIQQFLEGKVDEIAKTEYNAMYSLPLYDDQVTRMKCYNKTAIMRGKLYGTEIKGE